MRKSKIGYRFCGNCNPYIDTSGVLKKLKALDGGFDYVHWETGGYDALLIISGCQRDCTQRPADIGMGQVFTVAGPSVNGMAVEEERLAEEVHKLLLAWGKEREGS